MFSGYSIILYIADLKNQKLFLVECTLINLLLFSFSGVLYSVLYGLNILQIYEFENNIIINISLWQTG